MPATHQLDLYFKILTVPFITIADMVRSMRMVYAPHGIFVKVAGHEFIDNPALTDLDVGACQVAGITSEQSLLFSFRSGVPTGQMVVYFVRTLLPVPLNGCAAHPPARPGAVVANLSSRWTLAHEVGHVLGLPHAGDSTRLMTASGTFSITGTPVLTASEATTIQSSPLVSAI